MSVNIYSHFVTFLWLHAEMAFQSKICCKRFSSNTLTFLSGDSTVCHSSLHMCRSGNFPQILTAIGLSIRFSLLNTSQPSCLNNLISLQPSHCTRSSSLVTLARPPTCSTLKISDCLFWFTSPHLWINFLAHFVNHMGGGPHGPPKILVG